MNGAFSLAAMFAIFAGYALYRVVDGVRWGDRRHLWIAVAAVLPLSAAACGAFWIGSQYPTVNFWKNVGFGPDWECSNLGGKGAVVCARDLPPSLQAKPPAQTATSPRAD